jgi:hypothetical protein
VREGAVGVGHPVRVFPLLDRGAAIVGRIQQLTDRRSTIVFSLRLRAAAISQRMASA